MNTYVVTVKGNCATEAEASGYSAQLYKNSTDIEIQANTKKEAVDIADKFGKVVACYRKE